MYSGNSSSCSTDMATVGFFSFPSLISSTVYLSGSEFLVNFLSQPRCMSISIASFRWMQSSVRCPRHFWNRHHLVLPITFFSCEGGFRVWPQLPSAPLLRSQPEFSPRTLIGGVLRKATAWSLAFTGIFTFPFVVVECFFLEDLAVGSSFLTLLRLSV